MTYQRYQRGMALLVSLVLLLLLTIVAIAAANMSSLQERMAYNSQQQSLAFQSAEAGIQLWIDDFSKDGVSSTFTNQAIVDNDDGDPATTARRLASVTVGAPSPTNCATSLPSFSLNGANNSGTPQYACYNIVSLAKACNAPSSADATNCQTGTQDDQARAQNQQGHVARVFQ